MGRPQKHTDHPLFKLRLTLGKNSQPFTQQQLSTLVDIPLATIQSIESGRRSWTDEVRLKVRLAIWADWNERKKRWFFRHSEPPQQFTSELFDKYHDFIKKCAPIPTTDPETLKMLLDALFENASERVWMKLFRRLRDCLEECRTELDFPKELEPIFLAARDEIHFSPAFMEIVGGPSWKTEPLERCYRMKRREEDKDVGDYLVNYYKQCAEHYLSLCKKNSKPRTWSKVFRLDAPPNEHDERR
jgi:hypothetical protein